MWRIYSEIAIHIIKIGVSLHNATVSNALLPSNARSLMPPTTSSTISSIKGSMWVQILRHLFLRMLEFWTCNLTCFLSLALLGNRHICRGNDALSTGGEKYANPIVLLRNRCIDELEGRTRDHCHGYGLEKYIIRRTFDLRRLAHWTWSIVRLVLHIDLHEFGRIDNFDGVGKYFCYCRCIFHLSVRVSAAVFPVYESLGDYHHRGCVFGFETCSIFIRQYFVDFSEHFWSFS